VLEAIISRTFGKGKSTPDVRSGRVLKNVALSLAIKFGSILTNLMVVPLTINFVQTGEYGIWLTLSSVLGWLSFFDVGLGNGLRNKLAELNSYSDKSKSKAKAYVSTTYALLIIIVSFLFIIFLFINPLINWSVILNAPSIDNDTFRKIILALLAFVSIQFIVQIINVVLMATHAVAKASLINFVGQLLGVIAIFILSRTATGSLQSLVFVFGGIPPLVLIISSIYIYNQKSYKIYAPTAKAINWKFAKKLLTSGSSFFIIQLGVIVLYQSDNIVIAQLFGPEEVTTFNVAYKLFYVIIMIFTIGMTPYWSEFTEAFSKREYDWIRVTINKKLYTFYVWLLVATCLLLLVSPYLFRIWLSDKVHVPILVSIAMSTYVGAYMWYGIHVSFLNGIEKIRVQLYLVIVGAIVNIPLAILMAKFLGLPGVIFANSLVFFFMGLIVWYQTKKILNGKAAGVWLK
jgi:O-antigen/teichoic acid export membrane protein